MLFPAVLALAWAPTCSGKHDNIHILSLSRSLHGTCTVQELTSMSLILAPFAFIFSLLGRPTATTRRSCGGLLLGRMHTFSRSTTSKFQESRR